MTKKALYNALRIACTILLFAVVGYTQTTASYNRVRVKDTLTLSGNSLAEVVMTISAASKNNESPTAKAVYNYIQSFSLAGDVTGTPGATVVEAIQGNPVDDATPANEHTVLRWSGTAWMPNGINLYDIVTTSQTVDEKNNQVWVNTLSASITLNLPACNAANTGVKIEIAKAGSDDYEVVIEPAGSEEFIDGETSKSLYSRGIALSCTCHWTGLVGRWLFINL